MKSFDVFLFFDDISASHELHTFFKVLLYEISEIRSLVFSNLGSTLLEIFIGLLFIGIYARGQIRFVFRSDKYIFGTDVSIPSSRTLVW